MSISVIFANFNGERFLNKVIKSVLNQTHKDFELIVIDYGFNDNSIEIIHGHKNNNLNSLQLIKNKVNLGQ